ncbi:MAG: twin-arginine translocation signal domain-containing protein [Hyphomicrobiales bacterium]|nr:twin-arginine translocation signal domain-containing protein [Hyphomicrobiales bacterium]
MKQKCDRAIVERRSFLKLAGASAVAGGVALVSGGKSAEASTTADETGRLYKQTDHIKTYYELARF